MLVHLVLADGEVFQVDHAAAERRRQIEADEGRVIAVADVDLELVAVAQHRHPGQLAAVEQLVPQGLGDERQDEGQAGAADRLRRLELQVADDLLAAELPLAGDHQVDGAIRPALRAEQAEGEPQALLVQVALQAVHGGDVLEPLRVLEHLHAPHRLAGQDAARPVASQVGADEPPEPLVHGRDLLGVVARPAEEHREVGDHPIHHRQDPLDLGLVEGRDRQDLVEEGRMRQVVAAEALHRLVGGFRAPLLPRTAVGDDEVAPPERHRLGDPGKELRRARRHHEGEAPADAEADPRLGREAARQARPAQPTDDLAQQRGPERLLGPPQPLDEGRRLRRGRDDVHQVLVGGAAVLEVRKEEGPHVLAETLRDQGQVGALPARIERARRQAPESPLRGHLEQRRDPVAPGLRRDIPRGQSPHQVPGVLQGLGRQGRRLVDLGNPPQQRHPDRQAPFPRPFGGPRHPLLVEPLVGGVQHPGDGHSRGFGLDGVHGGSLSRGERRSVTGTRLHTGNPEPHSRRIGTSPRPP